MARREVIIGGSIAGSIPTLTMSPHPTAEVGFADDLGRRIPATAKRPRSLERVETPARDDAGKVGQRRAASRRRRTIARRQRWSRQIVN